MSDSEREELRRAVTGFAIDGLGREEFNRRVNVAVRLVYQTLASHFGDDPMGAVVGLIVLDHLTESAMKEAKQITSAATAASPEGWVH